MFYFPFVSPLAACLLCIFLLALVFSVLMLLRLSLPNRLGPELFVSHTSVLIRNEYFSVLKVRHTEKLVAKIEREKNCCHWAAKKKKQNFATMFGWHPERAFYADVDCFIICFSLQTVFFNHFNFIKLFSLLINFYQVIVVGAHFLLMNRGHFSLNAFAPKMAGHSFSLEHSILERNYCRRKCGNGIRIKAFSMQLIKNVQHFLCVCV